MNEDLPIRCSMATASILLRGWEVHESLSRGFWINYVPDGIPVFWPLIPGAEDMVGKAVEK